MSHMINPMAGIFTAQINALKDQADDPEDMVMLMIKDMEDTLCEARLSASQTDPGMSRELKQEVHRMEKELNAIKKKAMSLHIFQNTPDTKANDKALESSDVNEDDEFMEYLERLAS